MSAHCGARQDQKRPEACDRDDDDFEPITEAERHKGDRDHRHRRDRTQQLRAPVQATGRRCANEPSARPKTSPRPAPRMRPPKALISVSRVAAMREPSRTASRNAANTSDGGAIESLGPAARAPNLGESHQRDGKDERLRLHASEPPSFARVNEIVKRAAQFEELRTSPGSRPDCAASGRSIATSRPTRPGWGMSPITRSPR